MIRKQPIDWKDEWYPIEDATYLNFEAHAAIPRVALMPYRHPSRQRGGHTSSMTSLSFLSLGVYVKRWRP